MSVTAPETLQPTVNSAWRLDIDTSSTETAEWTQVRALNSFVPGVNDTVQDASDFDSEGWGSDAVTLRKWQITANAMRKLTAADEYPPGQEALRAAADDKELVHVRWYDRSTVTGEAYEGWGLVQWNPQGGTGEGLQVVAVTILGQGPRTSIAHPDTPAV